jgi:hypothetical protein
MSGPSEDQLRRDQELTDAIQEASIAEQLARLRVYESEPGMEQTNRERWDAQKRVVAALRMQHKALRDAIRKAMNERSAP